MLEVLVCRLSGSQNWHMQLNTDVCRAQGYRTIIFMSHVTPSDEQCTRTANATHLHFGMLPSEFQPRRAEVLICVTDSCLEHFLKLPSSVWLTAQPTTSRIWRRKNSTIQLVWELEELMITAQPWKADFRSPKYQAVALKYPHHKREYRTKHIRAHAGS